MADPENFDFTVEHHIAGDVGERVRAVISAAEATAAVIKREAEQEAEARRRLAEAERARYLESARAEVDELVRQRVQRMSELSDELLQNTERLLAEFSDAQQLRRQVERAVSSLAHAAEQLAAENRSAWGSPPPPAVAEPEPVREAEPVREPEPDAEAEPVAEPEPVAETEVSGEEPAVAEVVPEPDEGETAAEAEPAVEESAAEAEPSAAEPGEPHLREVPPNGDSAAAREKDDDTLAARLVALQMAVAGSSRGEVEEHLRVTFELDDTTSILNDVFGTETPPFAR